MCKDPDNPGWSWYGNQTYLDFSTANGGGYVGAIDDDVNNFPIGGMESHLNELWVYGTQGQPYLGKLSGTVGAYEINRIYQRAWTTPDCLLSVANDLWGGAGDGVDPLTAIQEFGDVRTFSAADPVIDRFQDYWDTDTAFAGYYPIDGQYWQCFPSYHRVLVAHTKLPAVMPDRIQRRFPWCEYELVKNDYTITGEDWDVYKWTASGSGTNEYYLELKAGGDPSIATQPDAITRARVRLDEGTAGSLDDLEWDYGDNDSLGYSTVYLRDNSGSPQTTGVQINEILIPRGLGTWDGNIYIGGSDGHVYKMDPSDYKDLSEYQMDPRWKSADVVVPFQYNLIEMYQLLASSLGGAGAYLEFFVNGGRATADASIEHTLPISDALTVNDMIMDVKDARFSVDPQQTDPWGEVGLEARSVMVAMTDVTLSGYPLYVGGIILMHEPLEV